MIKKTIMYFQKPGKENTGDSIKIVKERLKEGDIKYVVIASRTGETALRLCKEIMDLNINIVCVTLNAGYKEEYRLAFDKIIPELEKNNIRYIRAAHALSAGEKSVKNKYSGVYPLFLIADTYKTFSNGLKVAVEVSLMAADAGKIPAGEKVLSIGGKSRGCDTAIVLRSAYSHTILQELAIEEILCLPYSEFVSE